MLKVEEEGYNTSDTITRQPFRLSKKWRKKWEPNVDLMDNHLINHNLINHNLSRIGDPKDDSCSSGIHKSDSIGEKRGCLLVVSWFDLMTNHKGFKWKEPSFRIKRASERESFKRIFRQKSFPSEEF